MRNYAILAAVLLCAIVLSSVSDSAAVYTHSQSYSGELTFHREITIDDFFHYEMVDTVADSTAVYDKEQKSIILQNESGAFIQHTKLPAKGLHGLSGTDINYAGYPAIHRLSIWRLCECDQ